MDIKIISSASLVAERGFEPRTSIEVIQTHALSPSRDSPKRSLHSKHAYAHTCITCNISADAPVEHFDGNA